MRAPGYASVTPVASYTGIVPEYSSPQTSLFCSRHLYTAGPLHGSISVLTSPLSSSQRMHWQPHCMATRSKRPSGMLLEDQTTKTTGHRLGQAAQATLDRGIHRCG